MYIDTLKQGLLMVVLLASACSCPEVSGQTEIDPPPTAAEAIELLGEFYSQETGVHHDVRVRWTSTRMGEREAFGTAITCGEIWVWWDGESRVGATPLAHEMGHCYAGDVHPSHCWMNEGSDGHADPLWWGPNGIALAAETELSRTGL